MAPSAEPPELPAPSTADLAAAIHAGASYLLRRIDGKGKFVYRESMPPSVRLKPKYNWLRHAGAVYSLASYSQWEQNASVVPRLHLAARYLMQTAVAPVKKGRGLWAVWSLAEHTGKLSPPRAKLGGSGIALVALLTLHAQSPVAIEPAVLHGLGAFLCSMQRTDGSFTSIYHESNVTSGRAAFTSLYCTGAAARTLAGRPAAPHSCLTSPVHRSRPRVWATAVWKQTPARPRWGLCSSSSTRGTRPTCSTRRAPSVTSAPHGVARRASLPTIGHCWPRDGCCRIWAPTTRLAAGA